MAAKLPDRAVRDTLDKQFARLGSALSSPVRLRLLSSLIHADRTVDDIAHALGQSIANTSAHLKQLREAHLISRQREGRFIRYRLASPEVIRLCSTLQQVAVQTLPQAQAISQTYYQDPEDQPPIKAKQLTQEMAADEVVLIDLRPQEEYASGHLPGARSIPFDQIKKRMREIPKNIPVVAYCRGPWCVMERRGVDYLRRHGFDVTRVHDGIADWRMTGRKLEQKDLDP